jgi:hypothetical protein
MTMTKSEFSCSSNFTLVLQYPEALTDVDISSSLVAPNILHLTELPTISPLPIVQFNIASTQVYILLIDRGKWIPCKYF